MRINIFKVNESNKEKLKLWGKEIERRKREAVKTLEEENCLEESIRFFEINGETYAIGVMVAKTGESFLPINTKRSINKKHIQILKECFCGELPQEKIYHLRTQ